MLISFTNLVPIRDSSINVNVMFCSVCIVDGPRTVHQCCSVKTVLKTACSDGSARRTDRGGTDADLGSGSNEVCSDDVDRGPTEDNSPKDETKPSVAGCDAGVRSDNDCSASERTGAIDDGLVDDEIGSERDTCSMDCRVGCRMKW